MHLFTRSHVLDRSLVLLACLVLSRAFRGVRPFDCAAYGWGAATAAGLSVPLESSPILKSASEGTSQSHCDVGLVVCVGAGLGGREGALLTGPLLCCVVPLPLC